MVGPFAKSYIGEIMSIVALAIVSASDIAMVFKDFTYEWVDTNRDDFMNLLYQFGMDTQQPIERQSEIQHKNRIGRVVIMDRWVGNERLDREWIESGHASREAKDKASGSKLLNDIYRMKGHN